MDIKLKNKDRGMNKVVTALIIMVICAVAAAGMCASYGMIKKAGSDTSYNYFETGKFQEDLLTYCYGTASELVTGAEENPAEYYFAGISNVYEEDFEDKEDYKSYIASQKENFNNDVFIWKRLLTTENYNLKYFATSENAKVGNEEALETSSYDINDYQFFVQIDFDKDGLATVKDLKGAKEMGFTRSSYLNWINEYSEYEFKPIKNMSITFAVPTRLVGTDAITEGMNNEDTRQYTNYAALVALAVLGVLVVVAFLFPYAWAKGFAVLRVPFELWAVAAGITATGVAFACDYVARNSIAVNSITVGDLVLDHNTIMLGNFAIWFAIFLVTFLGVLAFKSIFKLGLKAYIKTRTIVGVCYYAMKRTVIKTVDYVSEIDLHDNNNKYILKLVGINAIILFLITCFWMAGIPIVIVYSIILFIIIKKYVDMISDKYRKLTEATNQIAEGNLDVTIEEDLGVFNPFKNNLEKIQGGFKKAVEEEVKSQRMKTDLISNVSHDLKTPLTAIITYVDLLRDENLSAEKRSEYVEVLDKKAQRLQVLIEDLFEMSKASSGNVNLNLEQVEVVSLLKQTLLEVEDRLEESGLTVKTTFPEEKVMLNLDSERTYRVFENLLLNTSKYAMKNTRVFVEVAEETEQVTITIKNISAEEINFAPNEIVERFVRGDQARNTEGSGLGLAISKSFVELQGGRFTIELDGDLFKAIISFPKK